jgi:hypothetical protein
MMMLQTPLKKRKSASGEDRQQQDHRVHDQERRHLLAEALHRRRAPAPQLLLRDHPVAVLLGGGHRRAMVVGALLAPPGVGRAAVLAERHRGERGAGGVGVSRRGDVLPAPLEHRLEVGGALVAVGGILGEQPHHRLGEVGGRVGTPLAHRDRPLAQMLHEQRRGAPGGERGHPGEHLVAHHA